MRTSGNDTYVGNWRTLMAGQGKNRQVGGDHYSPEDGTQAIDLIQQLGLPFVEGNVVKYVCRHRLKGGREDIEKAIHYLEMLLEFEYENSKTQKLAKPNVHTQMRSLRLKDD
jgi:hypothetical protein